MMTAPDPDADLKQAWRVRLFLVAWRALPLAEKRLALDVLEDHARQRALDPDAAPPPPVEPPLTVPADIRLRKRLFARIWETFDEPDRVAFLRKVDPHRQYVIG